VIATNRGKHFLFHTDKPFVNRTHSKIGIGLTADFKGTNGSSYQVLKFNGVEREVLYDTGNYQNVPKYLYPVKTNMDVLGMSNGDGRNNALFSYIHFNRDIDISYMV
jgi:putative DNA primase/helicase